MLGGHRFLPPTSWWRTISPVRNPWLSFRCVEAALNLSAISCLFREGSVLLTGKSPCLTKSRPKSPSRIAGSNRMHELRKNTVSAPSMFPLRSGGRSNTTQGHGKSSRLRTSRLCWLSRNNRLKMRPAPYWAKFRRVIRLTHACRMRSLTLIL